MPIKIQISIQSIYTFLLMSGCQSLTVYGLMPTSYSIMVKW